jgi:glyoxylase-like metal-dependent hydrolase (beta-lactamase superfamily II)/rhodanese-related sulfurtransferase
MVIRQIRSNDGTGTLSYFIIDENARAACIIDPNVEDMARLGGFLQEQELRITHIIDTHTHADHVSAAGALRQRTGAPTVMHGNTRNKWKIVDEGDKFGIGETLRANAEIPIDQYVGDGDILSVGSVTVHVLDTPGHTDNHIALRAGDSLFTGDLLLIGQAGRSDLPGGNPEEQYNSLFHRVLTLPDRTRIFPGHDYSEQEFAYLGDERKTNPFLQQRTKAEFVEFVKDFFPPFAENAAAGGRMTLQCGVQRVVQSGEEVQNITPAELFELLGNGSRPLLLDVREPMELVIYGAIEGVQNISVRVLKTETGKLPRDKNSDIVCVCQSGSRSLEASHYLQQIGYTRVRNLVGGTSGWIKAGFPVVRSSKMTT